MLMLFTVVYTTVYGQMSKSTFNSKFRDATKLMNEKLWNKSIRIWQELNDAEPNNNNVQYKLGYAYLQTANDKLKALPYLEAAIKGKLTKNYDPYDASESGIPLDAMYYLGRAYHLDFDTDEAINTYEKLLSDIPKKHRLKESAIRQIEMCQEAKKQKKNPKSHIVSNVGEIINTDFNDYTPVISYDESSMFFTSRRLRVDSSNYTYRDDDTGEYNEDIYRSYRDRSGNWSDPELVKLNKDQHTAAISTSADGKKLYLYYDDDGDGNIYETRYENNSWIEPELLGSDINTKAWETHVTFTPDEQTLYYVSNRKGGYGGRDIYRCVKLPNGEWSKSLNIGDKLNTKYEEDSPYISPDGKILFFSSNGHNSMGGFDIFYSTLTGDEEWSTPKNIGYPVNSVDDDVFYAPTANPARAYYSSQKTEGYGLKDIYVIDIPDAPFSSNLALLKGYIFAAEGEELPMDTYLKVTNEKNGQSNIYRPRERDGSYVTILPPCNTYHIEYFTEDVLIHEEYIEVPCNAGFNEIEKEVFLMPVYIDGPEKEIEEVIEQPEIVEPTIEIGVDNNDSFNKDNPEESIINSGDAYYEKYFVYDSNDEGVEETIYDGFIAGIVEISKNNGKIILTIESSASKVPSSRYENNTQLSKARNNKAKAKITKSLTAKGLKLGTDFEYAEPIIKVLGPEYENDASNVEKYEPFQYIKVWVKS